MEILITLREEEMACHVGTMKIARVNSEKIVEKCTNRYVKHNDYGNCRHYNCKLLHQKLCRQFFLLEYLYFFVFLLVFGNIPKVAMGSPLRIGPWRDSNPDR